MTKNEIFKVGDTVKIVNHKFPGLNPKTPIKKTLTLTPERLIRLYRMFKKPGESDLNFTKNMSFEYELKGLNYIGLTGEIIEVRETPETEYEKKTGDIAKYVIRFTTDHPSWKSKKATLYPSQVERISERKNDQRDQVKLIFVCSTKKGEQTKCR